MPAKPKKKDADATRTRILRAAVAEFSERGLAGGRIDRIAQAAEANKRLIYVYFGDKETLFEAALVHVLTAASEAVPVTEDDLPGFAGRLFDYVMANPQALRMNLWRMLERPEAGPDDTEIYEEKLRAMVAGAGRSGPRAGIGPSDLLILITGMATSWMLSPPGLQAAQGSGAASKKRMAEHRKALVKAAQAVSSAD